MKQSIFKHTAAFLILVCFMFSLNLSPYVADEIPVESILSGSSSVSDTPKPGTLKDIPIISPFVYGDYPGDW